MESVAVPELCQNPISFWSLRLALSEKQIPQVVEYPEKRCERIESLEPAFVLRRQMLYPAELRAHPWLLFDSTAVATLFRGPTLRRFLEHLEQVRQIRRQRSPLPGGGS